jgi:hypothetical protein
MRIFCGFPKALSFTKPSDGVRAFWVLLEGEVLADKARAGRLEDPVYTSPKRATPLAK